MESHQLPTDDPDEIVELAPEEFEAVSGGFPPNPSMKLYPPNPC